MIETKEGWEDPTDGYVGTWDNTGFRYGMFEIRCKIPSPSIGTFPSFWLYGGPTEIDIFEAGDPLNTISNNIFDHPNNHFACQNFYEKHSWDDVTTTFHTYSCVWTPTQVTYFYDGRELRTVTNTQVPTYPFNCKIITNLGMNSWASNTTRIMDIDYIKVYKPTSHNYNLSYKTSSEFIHDENLSGLSNFSNISSLNGSIAINNNNVNQIFYRGATDDRLYQATNTNGIWTSAIVAFQAGYVPNFLLKK